MQGLAEHQLTQQDADKEAEARRGRQRAGGIYDVTKHTRTTVY